MCKCFFSHSLTFCFHALYFLSPSLSLSRCMCICVCMCVWWINFLAIVFFPPHLFLPFSPTEKNKTKTSSHPSSSMRSDRCHLFWENHQVSWKDKNLFHNVSLSITYVIAVRLILLLLTYIFRFLIILKFFQRKSMTFHLFVHYALFNACHEVGAQ